MGSFSRGGSNSSEPRHSSEFESWLCSLAEELWDEVLTSGNGRLGGLRTGRGSSHGQMTQGKRLEGNILTGIIFGHWSRAVFYTTFLKYFKTSCKTDANIKNKMS